MNDDNLDSFISNNINNNENRESLQTPSSLAPRPKLKKIKRPKIKVASDFPPSPNKIMPQTSPEANVQEERFLAASPSSYSDNTIAENNSTSSASTTSNNDVLGDEFSDNIDNQFSEQEEVSPATSQNNLIQKKDTQFIDTPENNNDVSFNFDEDNEEFQLEDDFEDEILLEENRIFNRKVLYVVGFVCFLIGVFIGNILFSSKTVENHGLEGIVVNADVPAGRPRCGLTDKSQACVFYLMNWEKQELNGRDFYKLAAYFTGREEYMIETENLRYATVKIKPGHFAQLNIPALK